MPQYYNGYHRYHLDYGYQTSPIDSCSCSSTVNSINSDGTESETSRGGGGNGATLRGPWCICLVVCVIVATLAAGLSLPLALHPHIVDEPKTHEDRLEIVKRLLKNVPLIDGHNDLPWNLRKFLHNKLLNLNLSDVNEIEPWSLSKWSHTDIKRLRQGLLGAQFWSAYVPCKSQHLDSVQITLEQIDVIQRLLELNANHFQLVRNSKELLNVHKNGKIASLIGVEGGHSLGNSLAVLRTFYNLGARYLTITHNCDTQWARGSRTAYDRDGLTSFGRNVIKEMNRLGMIIDLSHTSANTARDALNISQAPVIFSHSSAYSLCNSTRNVPDDILKLVAHNGGVVMVNFYTYLVTCNDTATIDDVIKHINHIRAVAGIEHVGIGAGYDGINMTPSGLEDVSRYPHLFAELMSDPSWSEGDLALLAGENVLRVFGKVESIRDQWKLADVLPIEDSIPPLDTSCSSIYS